jgi:hypothetical protein
MDGGRPSGRFVGSGPKSPLNMNCMFFPVPHTVIDVIERGTVLTKPGTHSLSSFGPVFFDAVKQERRDV